MTETSKLKVINNALVIIWSLYSIAQYSFSYRKTTFFETAVIEVFSPVQRSTMSMKERIKYLYENYFKLVDTNVRNRELQKNIDVLEAKIFELSEIEKENQRLKELLKFGADVPKEKVLAQVVGWDSSNEFKVLRVNKGERDGIKLKSPVITINGLVGYVYRITPNYSDVLTILDQNNRVDSLVDRTRTHGIVEGLSSFKCHMKYVLRNDPVEVGDVVITAGLGNIYPKGIKVGTVSSIQKENSAMTQFIEVYPSVDFHKLEEVVILTSSEE